MLAYGPDAACTAQLVGHLKEGVMLECGSTKLMLSLSFHQSSVVGQAHTLSVPSLSLIVPAPVPYYRLTGTTDLPVLPTYRYYRLTVLLVGVY